MLKRSFYNEKVKGIIPLWGAGVKPRINGHIKESFALVISRKRTSDDKSLAIFVRQRGATHER